MVVGQTVTTRGGLAAITCRVKSARVIVCGTPRKAPDEPNPDESHGRAADGLGDSAVTGAKALVGRPFHVK